MNNFSIYIAGGIDKQSYIDISTALSDCNSHYCPVVYNPNDYYNSFIWDSQKGVMELKLNKVRNSNLIIANFTDNFSKLSVMAELAIAYDRQIPILGLCLSDDSRYQLKYFQEDMCLKIFDNLSSLIDYIRDCFLN